MLRKFPLSRKTKQGNGAASAAPFSFAMPAPFNSVLLPGKQQVTTLLGG